ncbi:MAG TPA: biopolymer transporter ExbD [Cytophagaceae bacterium]
MAELNTDSGGGGRRGGKGRKRANKASTKIDMTPMVDLAFLLITFFMLTTSFSKPQAMDVNMPDKTDDNQKMEIKESRTMTVILGENDKIYWYMGYQNPEVNVTDFSKEGIRNIIISKDQSIKDDLVVIVKPGKKSKYKNLVDILDEIHISGKKVRYSISKITERDLELIKDK